jgi:hypothetical protein
MHVTEFLDALMLGPNVEVVKPLLPDVLREMVEQGSLSRIPGTPRLHYDSSCKSQLKSLHHGRWILLLWFADEEVIVFGHDYITDHDEMISSAHLLKHSQKQIATKRRAEERLPLIATAGDEVKVSRAIVAF